MLSINEGTVSCLVVEIWRELNMNVAEWKQARQWLINSGVIPVTHPVTKPTVDLVDFARSLRDGVFLCNLLLKLKPGCVENFNSRPIAQVYCFYYIY